MKAQKFEYELLKRVEKLSRKNAQAYPGNPEAPWPQCPIILHQPKRPKK